MRTTTKRAQKNGAMAAASWDAAWLAYTAAVRSGDTEKLSAAKADVRSWSAQYGAPVPAWAV